MCFRLLENLHVVLIWVQQEKVQLKKTGIFLSVFFMPIECSLKIQEMYLLMCIYFVSSIFCDKCNESSSRNSIWETIKYVL